MKNTISKLACVIEHNQQARIPQKCGTLTLSPGSEESFLSNVIHFFKGILVLLSTETALVRLDAATVHSGKIPPHYIKVNFQGHNIFTGGSANRVGPTASKKARSQKGETGGLDVSPDPDNQGGLLGASAARHIV